MKLRNLLPIALLLLPPAARADNSITLAKVNGEPVTAQDIVNLFSDRHSGHAKFLGGNAEAREFLKIVIDDKLLVQEAYEIGLDKDPAIAQMVNELARTRAEERLIKTEIDAKARPSKEDVRKIWESLNFVMVVRQIAVDTKNDADEIRNGIMNGGDVDFFARDCSLADSRKHAGRIVVSWGQMEPAWESVVFALEPGEVSPVIATKDGFEVVVVENRVDVERPPFDKLAAQIENRLAQRRYEDRKRAFSDELWKKYGVVLKPIDDFLSADPETIVATWSNDGKLLLKDVASHDELRAWATLPPVRRRNEIDSRIRLTINAPLVALEAIERRTADDPGIVEELRKYREYLMEAALFRDHIFKDIAVSDDEGRKYYDDHKGELIAPEERHVAQILLGSEKDAASVRASLAAGTEFGAAVKKHSRDSVSAMQDGDLGWITPDKIPAAFKEVLKLAQGEVSKPIQSPSGWHLIKVLEIKPQRQLAFDEVKDKVTKACAGVKRDAARKFWVDKLRAASTIEIDDAAIHKFVKANEFTGAAPPQHSLQ